VLALRHPLQWDGGDGGAMAKKDAASKRLAEEIALAKRIKKAREETPKKVPEETPRDLDGLLTRPLGWPFTGHWELKLDENALWNKPILDAFKAFDLDPRYLSHWRQLLGHLSYVFFPGRPGRPAGAPRKWTDERLCQLLAGVAAYKRKNPKASDTAICKWLKKKWPNHAPARLRRVLQVARNPKHNTELARVVSILERRLGPDATVSWVIARADELWGS
jgi:hypothetical protein